MLFLKGFNNKNSEIQELATIFFFSFFSLSIFYGRGGGILSVQIDFDWTWKLYKLLASSLNCIDLRLPKAIRQELGSMQAAWTNIYKLSLVGFLDMAAK